MFVFKLLTTYRTQPMLSALLLSFLVLAPAHADDAPASMPTFSPIPPQIMLEGRGPEFNELNYQLVSPLLRKCTNDWPSTRYVEFKPEVKGKVVMPSGAFSALSFLELLSQQTGRRFAVQRGIEQRTAVVVADGEEWTALITRFVRETGLTFEAIQDIAVISDPASAVALQKPNYSIVVIATGLLILGGFLWLRFSASRNKREREVRGGWHDR